MLILVVGEVSDFIEINYGDYCILVFIGDISLIVFNNKLIIFN